MTATKQHTQTPQRRPSHSGKEYAMTHNIPDNKPLNELNAGEFRALISDTISTKKAKPAIKINPTDKIKVGDVIYGMNDMVDRLTAAKIANYHPNNISEKASSGEIKAYGRGKNTRYKVADCVALSMNKYSHHKKAS